MAATITFDFKGESGPRSPASFSGQAGPKSPADFARDAFAHLPKNIGRDVVTPKMVNDTGPKDMSATRAASEIIGGNTGAMVSRLASVAGPLAAVAAGVTAAKEAFAALVNQVKMLITGIRAVDSKFTEMGDTLAIYSGALATSKANDEVRKLLHDIERAEKYGTGLAAYDSAKATLERAITKLSDDVLMPMIPLFIGAVEIATVAVNNMAAAYEAGKGPAVAAAQQWHDGMIMILPGLGLVSDRIYELAEEMRKKEREGQGMDPMEEFVAMGAGMAFGGFSPGGVFPGFAPSGAARPKMPKNPRGEF